MATNKDNQFVYVNTSKWVAEYQSLIYKVSFDGTNIYTLEDSPEAAKLYKDLYSWVKTGRKTANIKKYFKT